VLPFYECPCGDGGARTSPNSRRSIPITARSDGQPRLSGRRARARIRVLADLVMNHTHRTTRGSGRARARLAEARGKSGRHGDMYQEAASLFVDTESSKLEYEPVAAPPTTGTILLATSPNRTTRTQRCAGRGDARGVRDFGSTLAATASPDAVVPYCSRRRAPTARTCSATLRVPEARAKEVDAQ